MARIFEMVTRPVPELPSGWPEREIALNVLLLRTRENCRTLLWLGWGGEPLVAEV